MHVNWIRKVQKEVSEAPEVQKKFEEQEQLSVEDTVLKRCLSVLQAVFTNRFKLNCISTRLSAVVWVLWGAKGLRWDINILTGWLA